MTPMDRSYVDALLRECAHVVGYECRFCAQYWVKVSRFSFQFLLLGVDGGEYGEAGICGRHEERLFSLRDTFWSQEFSPKQRPLALCESQKLGASTYPPSKNSQKSRGHKSFIST